MLLTRYVAAARQRIGGETSIVAGTIAIQVVLRLVGSMIMTRLLTSAAFGVVGILTSVAVTFALISDIGIQAFIVRHRGSDDADFINELWTLKLLRSIALTAISIVLSGPIAQYLEKPELQAAIVFNSFFFILEGLDSLGNLLALKTRSQRQISRYEIIAQIVGLIVPIGFAIVLRSFWAILIGNMVTQIFKIWLSYRIFAGIRHRWRFSRARAAELWKFSRYITGSTMITLIIGQADKVVLAKIMPLGIYGLYILGAGLAALPTGIAMGYAGRILLPRYAETARLAPERLRHDYYASRLSVHLLFGLGVATLAGAAPLVISVLYDHRYLATTAYFQILLIGSFFSLGTMAVNEVMLAQSKPVFTFTTNLVRLAYLVGGGFLAFHYHGPIGLIWVVGTIELVAQVYGWAQLWRQGILSFRKEALILATAPIGFAIGTAGALAGKAVLAALHLG